MTISLFIVVPMLLFILVPLAKRSRLIVVAILMGGIYLLSWPSSYKNYRLEKEGQHTTGILLSKNCETRNSQAISYKFTVGGAEFRGTAQSGKGNQPCERFQTGDQVFITYLPRDPSINTPDREVDSDIVLGAFFTIGLFVVLVLCNGAQGRFLAEKRRRKSRNA